MVLHDFPPSTSLYFRQKSKNATIFPFCHPSATVLPRFCQSTFRFFDFIFSHLAINLPKYFYFPKNKACAGEKIRKEYSQSCQKYHDKSPFVFAISLLSHIRQNVSVYAKMVRSTANKYSQFFRVRDFYIIGKIDFLGEILRVSKVLAVLFWQIS